MKIELPYVARPWQTKQHLLMDSSRFCVLVVHRNAGKTWFALAEMVKRVLTSGVPNATGLFMAPTKEQAKKTAWTTLKSLIQDIPGVKINENETHITFENGSRILLVGAEQGDALRGLRAVFIVMDEVASMPAETWPAIVFPMLNKEKDMPPGEVSKVLFIGTPQGKNYFYTLYNKGMDVNLPDWRAAKLDVYSTGEFSPEEIKKLEENEPDKFSQEYLVSFDAAASDSFWGDALDKLEAEGRLCDFGYEPEVPVLAGWDFGLDGTVVWFMQIINGKPHIFDVEHSEGAELREIAPKIKAKKYPIEKHLLPHDADSKKGSVIDRRKTIRGEMQNLNLWPCKVIPRDEKEKSIRFTRRFINSAKFSKRIEPAFMLLKEYRSKRDVYTGMLTGVPIHDKASHFADALMCLAIGGNVQIGGQVNPNQLVGHQFFGQQKRENGPPISWNMFNL